MFTREDLSEEQLLFGRAAEEFMRTEVVPRAAEIYAKNWPLTRELIKKAADRDFTRLEIPEAYGGLGLDKVSTACVGEQLGLLPSFAGSLGAHTSIGTLPIVYFGNDEQRQRYLPRLANGELIGAFALTEPEAGSDALSARTTATLTPDGKHYSLRGQKLWITNGGFADIFTVFAKIDGKHFTAFIVERGMGVISGADEHKLGLDGTSTTALMFDDVKVPVENVLGTVGEGHKVAFNILNFGRVKLGTRNIGGAKQALTGAVQLRRSSRKQFGQTIANFGLIKHKIAEIAVRCFVGDAMVFRSLGEVDEALGRVDANDVPAVLKTIEEFAIECSINKVWSSEALAYVVDEALQVYGGNGYSREFPAERAYRDARITRIYEGTNEINRLIVGTRLAKSAASASQSPAPRRAVSTAPARPTQSGLLAQREASSAARSGDAVRVRPRRAEIRQGAQQRTGSGRRGSPTWRSRSTRSRARFCAPRKCRRAAAHGNAAVAITQVFAADAADRLEHAAKNALAAIDGPILPTLETCTRSCATARQHHRAPAPIADAVIDANRYPL